jgi:hypothetical protein
VRRVGGGEFVVLDEVPGDRDTEGDRADDRCPQVRVVGRDGLGDLRLVAGDATGAPASRSATPARICSAASAGVPLSSGTGAASITRRYSSCLDPK